MNKIQLIVMWLAGLAVSGLLFQTGARLLTHAANTPETWDTGYPITVMAGTVWSYVIPILIIGGLLIISFKDHGK